jgi:hypothetical protein
MAQPTKATIKRYMQSNVDGHVDTLTGELNMTTLAEDALSEYCDYEDEEPFFEVAHEVLKWFERTRKPYLR